MLSMIGTTRNWNNNITGVTATMGFWPPHHFVTELVDLFPFSSCYRNEHIISLLTFQDDVDYLDSLGKTQVADVKRSADIGVAEAERDAGIREAEYERGCQDKRFQADTSIAGKKHSLFRIDCQGSRTGLAYH